MPHRATMCLMVPKPASSPWSSRKEGREADWLGTGSEPYESSVDKISCELG